MQIQLPADDLRERRFMFLEKNRLPLQIRRRLSEEQIEQLPYRDWTTTQSSAHHFSRSKYAGNQAWKTAHLQQMYHRKTKLWSGSIAKRYHMRDHERQATAMDITRSLGHPFNRTSDDYYHVNPAVDAEEPEGASSQQRQRAISTDDLHASELVITNSEHSINHSPPKRASTRGKHLQHCKYWRSSHQLMNYSSPCSRSNNQRVNHTLQSSQSNNQLVNYSPQSSQSNNRLVNYSPQSAQSNNQLVNYFPQNSQSENFTLSKIHTDKCNIIQNGEREDKRSHREIRTVPVSKRRTVEEGKKSPGAAVRGASHLPNVESGATTRGRTNQLPNMNHQPRQLTTQTVEPEDLTDDKSETESFVRKPVIPSLTQLTKVMSSCKAYQSTNPQESERHRYMSQEYSFHVINKYHGDQIVIDSTEYDCFARKQKKKH